MLYTHKHAHVERIMMRMPRPDPGDLFILILVITVLAICMYTSSGKERIMMITPDGRVHSVVIKK